MKSISLSVSENDYEAFRRASAMQGRSIAHLIREAMAVYRAAHLVERESLRNLPVLAGHRAVGPLPPRSEVYDEVFAGQSVDEGCET